MASLFLLRQHPTFFQTANVYRTADWSVFYAPNAAIQLVVRATKKVASTSVERHIMVRRVREAWLAALKQTANTQNVQSLGLALVIFPTKKTLSADFGVLTTAAHQTIITLCKKHSLTST